MTKDLYAMQKVIIRQLKIVKRSLMLTRASEAGVCRGSDTPNYLCGGDIDMYIPPRKT